MRVGNILDEIFYGIENKWHVLLIGLGIENFIPAKLLSEKLNAIKANNDSLTYLSFDIIGLVRNIKERNIVTVTNNKTGGNPYHDEEGKFCSAGDMGKAVDRLLATGDIFAWAKLRAQYESLLSKDSALTPESIAKLLIPMNTNPLANYTPVQVDEELANLYTQSYQLEDQIVQKNSYIDDYKKRLDPQSRLYERSDYYREGITEKIARLEEEKEVLKAQLADSIASRKPFEDEYARRNYWTRAFLVTNGNGHVHRSMSCSTCYPTTRYAWMTEYSGKAEEEIVTDAGDAACTVCYPSAPVDVLKRPTKFELPNRKAAREEREKKAAEKRAKEQATGIWTPDGEELREADTRSHIRHGREAKSERGQIIKTERTAIITAVDILADNREGLNWTYYDGGVDDYALAKTEQQENTFYRIVEAVAHKNGRSEDEIIKEFVDKANKKRVATNKQYANYVNPYEPDAPKPVPLPMLEVKNGKVVVKNS